MRKLSKKSRITAAVAGVALVAVGGGAAYAYWTTTGSGSGEATNAPGGGTVTLHATFAGGLAPGNQVNVAYSADNATTSSTVVGALSANVTTNVEACLPAWFEVTAVTTNTLVAANSTGISVGSGILKFNDSTTVNQDACKGAVVTVNVTSL
ncbi:hypothetical protein [Paenarthrobacter nitroguajacolicus]|uniref:hypothetical protein n=1 Tax=Paenarthrobacter nitroguajacolicus TaxID=211146 RepID=UPI000A939B3E|nr:hypothetical protein [Paenarthrobacter nitroguajacolicus]